MGFYVLVAGWWMVTTATVAFHVPDFVARFIADQEALHPDQPLPPPGYDKGMDGTIYIGLALIVVAVIGLVATIIVGTIRRWTWMYYSVIGALVLQALAGLLAIFEVIQVPDELGARNTIRVGLSAFGIVGMFLLGQMLGALIRTGPWATRRVLFGQQ